MHRGIFSIAVLRLLASLFNPPPRDPHYHTRLLRPALASCQAERGEARRAGWGVRTASAPSARSLFFLFWLRR